jgi:hypothetical protein
MFNLTTLQPEDTFEFRVSFVFVSGFSAVLLSWGYFTGFTRTSTFQVDFMFNVLIPTTFYSNGRCNNNDEPINHHYINDDGEGLERKITGIGENQLRQFLHYGIAKLCCC